ncbi:MAG: carotenoid 1,2-hydratase, partial [Calditrichaeota bacterium]|nr:carotenoid 1,2-hydratase [Calditrichota bacterium]
SGEESPDYLKALQPRTFSFPGDLGPHPGFKTEWWYYTGNLTADNGRRFGYQFTIFRSALMPPSQVENSRPSQWAASQLYLGHFALSDLESGTFYSFEKISREALGLAGARAFPFRVWVENWITEAPVHAAGEVIPPLRIEAAEGPVQLKLDLQSRKPVVLQGDRGLSPKSNRPGNASYYYSLTRLESAGEIRIGEERFTVSGLSWMDREWSTSALDSNQTGWDWFSLQLSDSSDLMVFQLRDHAGEQDFAKGSLVRPSGEVLPLQQSEIRLYPRRWWQSPAGVRYPVAWDLQIPAHHLDLRLEAAMDNQELAVSIRYWEGAVDITGEQGGRAVSGRGYLEMTGYGP